MRVLITGVAGLLGAHVAAALARRHEIVGSDRHAWWGNVPLELVQGDLGADGFAEHLVRETQPDVLIHCAGLVDVDRCEREPALAYAVNAGVTQRLARTLAPDAFFVYITTDGIFRGDSAFSSEETLPCPRTVYGRSKLHGEWEVQIAGPSSLIVRTNFYGWSSGRKQTSAEWLYSALTRGSAMTLFDDFYFTPLYVAEFVKYLQVLIDRRHSGILNVVGRDRVSKYEFGCAMANIGGFSPRAITRGSIESASLLAPRPRDMSLSTDALTTVLGHAPQGMIEGLQQFIADRERPLGERVAGPAIRAQQAYIPG